MVSGQKIRKVRNVLQNRTAVSLLSIFLTCAVIFMMTGALYFRNEVIITDAGKTLRVYTMQTSPENILAEQGITLTGQDYFSFEEFKDEADSSTGRTAMSLSITRSHNITVQADGRVLRTEAYYGETVGEILNRMDISLERNDIVTPAIYERITGESDIKVSRAFGITLYIEGVTLSIPVSPYGNATIGDVLHREGIALSASEVVSQNLSSLAYPGMEATVNTRRYVERVEEVLIPYQTFEEETKLLPIGTSEVQRAGVPGSERLTVIDTIVDGVIIESEIIFSEHLSSPVDEMLLIGTALAEPISKRMFDEIELVNGVPVSYEFMLSGRSTAYTAGPTAGTASGRPLQVGTVAVDPRVIPYGSLLYIVTQCGRIVYGAAVAADTGEFIHTTDVVVDVFMGLTSENLQDARDWGSRKVDVYVINTGQY
jgi:uncharacterized protein YabE (DUF348 family)/3D (Asp-Asp-Asp) domain-containing protein